MEPMAWLAAVIILCAIVYLVRARGWKEEVKDSVIVGQLLVDATDPESGGGVYLNIRQDPKTFTDGQIVQLEVILVKTQEKHT